MRNKGPNQYKFAFVLCVRVVGRVARVKSYGQSQNLKHKVKTKTPN